MKAWVLHGINDLRLEEINTPTIGENEVLLAVKAAGICGSDIPRVFHTGTYSYPLIPGHEFAGQVIAVGASVDEKWQGKRVGVFPLIPCGECLPCQKSSMRCAGITVISVPAATVDLRSMQRCRKRI